MPYTQSRMSLGKASRCVGVCQMLLGKEAKIHTTTEFWNLDVTHGIARVQLLTKFSSSHHVSIPASKMPI
jgi:hypothetical protein